MEQGEFWLSGNKALSAGTVVSEEIDEIVVDPFPASKGAYRLVFRFENDAAVDETTIRSTSEGDLRVITIKNCPRDQEITNAKPYYIADKAGMKVMLHFFVSLIGPVSTAKRILSYTLYDGGPVND
jgi:hypothetical protein